MLHNIHFTAIYIFFAARVYKNNPDNYSRINRKIKMHKSIFIYNSYISMKFIKI